MTELQISFFEASKRRQRYERGLRYGAVAAVLGLVVLVPLVAVWSNYRSWRQAQPWAHLTQLASGRHYPLVQDIANVGRPVRGVEGIKHQVGLLDRRISRLHLMITNTGIVIDWRSLYGTTLNGEWLRYGESGQLAAGDMLVLSGLHVFAYHPAEWRPWHYVHFSSSYFHSSSLSDDPPADGWALLVDGRRRTVLPIVADEQYVTLRDGGITLSDQRSDDAVLIVRRRVFRDLAPLVDRRIEAFDSEQPTAKVDYFSVGALDDMEKLCPTKKPEISVLTLQPLPAAKGRITSEVKDGDYDRAHIVLPEDKEAVWLIKGATLIGLGDILFRTDNGSFQVVPTQTTDVGEICADPP